MRLMGLERDNTTSLSTTNPRGFSYSASFEFYPFYEGRDCSVYKGILNGGGPRRGEFCVVKVMRHRDGEETDWHELPSIVLRAHALATNFNMLVKYQAIQFTWPVIAEMETVSDFIPLFRFFKPHDKRLHWGEKVLIEELIEGKFQTFSSTEVWINPDSQTDVIRAFSHYTWYATKELVICGLQGVAEGRSFQLTTPTIHSTYCQYGPSDKGVVGISDFFSSHRCNYICSAWPGLDVPGYRSLVGNNLQVHGARRAYNQPRRNCNMFHSEPEPTAPEVPSAPTIETTRF